MILYSSLKALYVPARLKLVYNKKGEVEHWLYLDPLNPTVHFWLCHTAHCAHTSSALAKWWDRERCVDYLHSAMHIVAARLGCKGAMVGTEWASFHPSCMNGLKNTTLAL